MANLAPIFLPKASRRDLAQGTWKTFPDELLIFRDSRVEPRPKIAGFDLDGTLIRTASGNVFPRDNDDWQLWSSEVVGEIQRLQDDGFKICIFTNQKGIHAIQAWKTNREEEGHRISTISALLAAMEEDGFNVNQSTILSRLKKLGTGRGIGWMDPARTL